MSIPSINDFNKLPSDIQMLVGGYLPFQVLEEVDGEYVDLRKCTTNAAFIRDYFRHGFDSNISLFKLGFTYGKAAQLVKISNMVDRLNLSYPHIDNPQGLGVGNWLRLRAPQPQMPTMTPEELENFLVSSPQLRHLSLLDVRISDRFVPVFENHFSVFDNLETLSMSRNRMHLVVDLFSRNIFNKLQTLELTDSSLRKEDVQKMVDCFSFINLTSLDLSGNCLFSDGVKVLTDSPQTTRLTKLYLAHNGMNNEGLEHLMGSPFLRKLSLLDLSDNFIEFPAIEAFSSSSCLPALSYLGFSGNGIEMPSNGMLSNGRLGRLRCLEDGNFEVQPHPCETADICIQLDDCTL